MAILCPNLQQNVKLCRFLTSLCFSISALGLHQKIEMHYIQSTIVLSNSKALSETLRDIRISTYQIFRIGEKIIRTTTFNKFICNWTPDVRDISKILWKRGEIAPLSTIFFYLLLDFHVRQGQDFHFEISGYSR